MFISLNNVFIYLTVLDILEYHYAIYCLKKTVYAILLNFNLDFAGTDFDPNQTSLVAQFLLWLDFDI